MHKFSILLVVVSALLLPSFTVFHNDTPAHVIGTWASGNSKDAKLRSLVFTFTGEGVEIKNEAGHLIANGVLRTTQEAVAIASDPFVYEKRIVMQIEVTSTAQIALPNIFRVTSVSSSRMMICYQDEKRDCYTTLRKLSH